MKLKDMTFSKIPDVLFLFLILVFFTSCEEKPIELISPSGGYQEIIFDNGTQVRLGPQSKAVYKKSDSQMNLEGEAAINVASGSFKVITTNGILNAELGQFRIHSRRTSMNIFTIKGKAVATNVDGGASKLVTEGMSAYYNGKNLAGSSERTVEQMTNDKYWVFQSASVLFILESVTAQYGVTFEGGDANLNKVFSGFIPRDDLHIALSILTRSLGLEYQEEGSNYVLSNSAY